MRNVFRLFAVLLFSLALFAQTAAQPPASAPNAAPAALPAGAPSPELVAAYFKSMFGYDPNLEVKLVSIGVSPIPGLYDITAVFITPQGQQLGHLFVSKDLRHAIAGDMLPFGADPFGPVRRKLASSVFGPGKGPADAKVLIVEFADLECPACRDAQPLMQRLRDDFPETRFVFQSFPLPELHPWAVRAASYLDCIQRSTPDHAFTFIEAVYDHQKDIETAVRKTDAAGKTTIDPAAVTQQLRNYTEYAGADPAKTQACAESPATAERIKRSEQLGDAVDVAGTPTIFVNGRRIGNPTPAQYEGLKSIVTFAEEQAKAEK